MDLNSGTLRLRLTCIVDTPLMRGFFDPTGPDEVGVFTNHGTPGSPWVLLPTDVMQVGTANNMPVWEARVNDVNHLSLFAVVIIPEPLAAVLMLSAMAACVLRVGRRRRGGS